MDEITKYSVIYGNLSRVIDKEQFHSLAEPLCKTFYETVKTIYNFHRFCIQFFRGGGGGGGLKKIISFVHLAELEKLTIL